jgi:CheY-like chemotaxis protein
MTATSEPGRGTTIALWLPQAECEDLPAEPGEAASEDADAAIRPELTVLVVDDDLLVSAGTAAMLEDLGHRVVEASSGTQALEALRSGAPRIDVVITDHAMPGMTGLELARRIQETFPRMPIILASGYAEAQELADYGAVPRLAKPFRQSELAAVIYATRTGGAGLASEAPPPVVAAGCEG